MRLTSILLTIILTPLLAITPLASGQDTAFTYQGRLLDGTNAANGSYDLRFILFDVDQFGFPIGGILTNQDVAVRGGLFTVTLDFGAAPFVGTQYWMEIGVRPGVATGAFTTLVPRQPLTPAPYALYAGLAGGVTNGSITAAALSPGAVGTSALANGAVTAAKLGTNGALSSQVLTFTGSEVGWKSQNFWQLGGNSGVTGPGNILGTLDNVAVELRVNNRRALRLEPTTNAPNLIGGFISNRVAVGVVGATIAGGGGGQDAFTNYATDNYATIGGGSGHMAGDGSLGVNDAEYTTIGGGSRNRAVLGFASVGGGLLNLAYGLASTIGGGQNNQATNNYTTVAGGFGNRASALRATVGGGGNNRAQGQNATVPGGDNNDALGNYSFAAGRQAKATNHGAFVWADSATADFASTSNNQFLVRASGGVGIGLIRPTHPLHVGSTLGAAPINFSPQRSAVENATIGGRAALLALAGTGGSVSANRVEMQMEADEGGRRGIMGTASAHPLEIRTDNQPRLTLAANGDLSVNPANSLSFGSTTRQMLNLSGSVYGIGVQTSALYFRSDLGYAWFRDGVHSNTQNDPGAGGFLLMRLDIAGNLFTGGAINPPSDRNVKKDFAPVDTQDVLRKVAALPLHTWTYTNESAGIRHLGPVAQDFHAAFGVGADDKHIATVDADGVALAAIQGLNRKMEEREAALREDLKRRDAENAELKARLAALEKLITRFNLKAN